jgi:hypothetical protein
MSERTSREKTLYRYHMALERGDFATVAAILSQAEQDATLARMVLELNAALEAEADGILSPQPVLRANHSTNGQRHPSAPAKEELPMTFYETTRPGRTLPAVRSLGRKHVLTLIAAMIVVALISVALLSSGLPASFDGASGGPVSGASGPDGLPGAAQQVVTATPSATFTPTPVPTASPTHTPTPFGPQPDPLILTATAIVDQATNMAGGMDVVTATPFPPTVVPPEGFTMSGAAGWLGGGRDLPVDMTISFNLGAGDVNLFRITAEGGGALMITTTSLDFTPRLLVVALDDPDLGIRRNQDGQSPPTVTVPVSPGGRVLIFVYSADREATGQFLINAHMGQ